MDNKFSTSLSDVYLAIGDEYSVPWIQMSLLPSLAKLLTGHTGPVQSGTQFRLGRSSMLSDGTPMVTVQLVHNGQTSSEVQLPGYQIKGGPLDSRIQLNLGRSAASSLDKSGIQGRAKRRHKTQELTGMEATTTEGQLVVMTLMDDGLLRSSFIAQENVAHTPLAEEVVVPSTPSDQVSPAVESNSILANEIATQLEAYETPGDVHSVLTAYCSSLNNQEGKRLANQAGLGNNAKQMYKAFAQELAHPVQKQAFEDWLTKVDQRSDLGKAVRGVRLNAPAINCQLLLKELEAVQKKYPRSVALLAQYLVGGDLDSRETQKEVLAAFLSTETGRSRFDRTGARVTGELRAAFEYLTHLPTIPHLAPKGASLSTR